MFANALWEIHLKALADLLGYVTRVLGAFLEILFNVL
jgi:hypothetical protein